MNFTLQLDDQRRVLLVTFGETLTDEIFLAGHAVVKEFSEKHGPHHAIADFSSGKNFRVSVDLPRLISYMSPAVPPGMRRIAVAPQPEIYGSARVVQALRDQSPAPLEIVLTIEGAFALLGLGSPSFVAVEGD
jgi:hypothetical protein